MFIMFSLFLVSFFSLNSHKPSPAIESLTRWRQHSPRPTKYPQRHLQNAYRTPSLSSSCALTVSPGDIRAHEMPQPPTDDGAHVTMLTSNATTKTTANNISSRSTISSNINTTTPSKWCSHCLNHHQQQLQASATTATSAFVVGAAPKPDSDAHHNSNDPKITNLVAFSRSSIEAHTDDRLKMHNHHMTHNTKLHITSEAKRKAFQNKQNNIAMSCRNRPDTVHNGHQRHHFHLYQPHRVITDSSCGSNTHTASSTSSLPSPTHSALSLSPPPSQQHNKMSISSSCSWTKRVQSSCGSSSRNSWSPQTPRIGLTLVTAFSIAVVCMLFCETGVSASAVAAFPLRQQNQTVNRIAASREVRSASTPAPLPESMKPDQQGREYEYYVRFVVNVM